MNPSQREEEGHRLMAEAAKQASSSKSGGFFKSLFGSSSSSNEEAAETYVRAAQSFKLAKAWVHAGKAYDASSDVYVSLGSDHSYDAAARKADAAKAYKNVGASLAVPAYTAAINLHADGGRFQQCARLQKDLSELLEVDVHSSSPPDALIEVAKAYEQTADYYDMDDAASNANTARVKAATFRALAGDYSEAADTLEGVAKAAAASPLLKYGAREHFLKAGLCKLCNSDLVAAERAVTAYSNADPSFESSREGKLLANVVQAVADSDESAFTSTVFEYDSISKLDDWKTTILLRIKNQIKAADGGEEDLT